MSRNLRFMLATALLFLSILACNLPDGMPAPAMAPTFEPEAASQTPTPAPTPEPETMPEPAAGATTLAAAAMKTSFARDGSACQLPETATLVVNPDGSAELSTTGTSIVDHTSCTRGTSTETWYINGKVDELSQTITFTTCNMGNFNANGAVTYANQILVGAVSCTSRDGVPFMTLTVGQ